jgi:GMP synthase-like glutamine amidotransferase
MSPVPKWVILQHVAYEGPGAIVGAITARGHAHSVVRIDQGEAVPGSLDGMAGLVVMGGPMGVHDIEAHPWLMAERDLLKGAVTAELPVLGVCLGAQQLAHALGADVTSGNEPEVGVGEVHLTNEGHHDPVLGPGGSPLPCMHWHQDTFGVPPGAVLLAWSDLCPHQAFRVGSRAYGLQFHVEMTAVLAAHWGPRLPPGVFVRASDIAHIGRAGPGILERFVVLAEG